MDYEQKLKALRAKYPDDESQSIVSDWEKKLKLANLTANLRTHDGMKIILTGLEDEYHKITQTLSTEEKLFANQDGMILGQVLHARRKWIKSFLNIFSNAEKQIKGATDLIDKKLFDDNEDN